MTGPTGSVAVTAALRRMPLFEGLSEENLRALADQTLYQRFSRGQTLFNRGDRGDCAFIIVSGSVDLVVETPDGRELILARLGPGEHFGEMALMDDLDRSAAARAAAPTEAVVVLRRAFLQAIEKEPGVSRQIIRSLVQRLRAADEKMEAFAYLDAEARVARCVLDLAEIGPDALQLSHEELASMAATSRQTTTRVLNEWEELGYVALSRRGILVTDPEALLVLAEI